MRIIRDIRRETLGIPHAVLTIGSFDGVHLGHQHILQEVVREARACSGMACVLTMSPHPREFFSPDHAPNLLTSDAKKARLFEAAGMDAMLVLPFNHEVASMEPEVFVREIVRERCGAEALIVGHDFRFGRGAQGDYDFLQRIAPGFGFVVRQIEPLLIHGERISSTVIRERVLQGELEEAERFLGRKYAIVGEVITGRGIGKTLGFPTANIKPHHNAVPAHGVYAARVRLDGGEYTAAVNIGIAPTIRNEDIIVEAFLLDFDGRLAGSEIEVVFHKRLRPERKFPSHEALIEQITLDVESVRQHFARPA